jgi:hypothetical protein
MPAESPLRTSPEVGELAKALAAAQGQIRTAEFDRVNPAFKSGYATLASIYTACRAALSSQGIAVVQALSDGEGGRIACSTRLLHSSGQWMESTVSVDPGRPGAQPMGSAASYLRRYSLVAFVGIATGEEDDGEAATPPPKGKPSKAEREATDAQRKSSHHPSWDGERAAFAVACRDAGTSLDDVSAYCEAHGRPRPSAMDAAQRGKLRAWLADHGVEVTEWAARQSAGGEA